MPKEIDDSTLKKDQKHDTVQPVAAFAFSARKANVLSFAEFKKYKSDAAYLASYAMDAPSKEDLLFFYEEKPNYLSFVYNNGVYLSKRLSVMDHGFVVEKKIDRKVFKTNTKKTGLFLLNENNLFISDDAEFIKEALSLREALDKIFFMLRDTTYKLEECTPSLLFIADRVENMLRKLVDEKWSSPVARKNYVKHIQLIRGLQ